MSKLKFLRMSGLLLIVLLVVAVGSVFAGELATFDNPQVATCSLSGLSISGTLTIGDTVYVEEYLNGNLRNTFTGQGGRYSGYVSRFNAGSYPYGFATVLTFKNAAGGIIEQYVIEGDCTAEDTGSVKFYEIDPDDDATNPVMDGELARFDNPQIASCSLVGLSISGTLTIGDTVYVEEYLNGNLRNTFTGQGGRYSGYVSRFNAASYPYDFATVLSFKDASGNIIEQYVIEGDCTAEDSGSVQFREIELDAPMFGGIS